MGAQVLVADVECRICGCALDGCLEHAETCAQNEATKGHYAVVRAMADGLRMADPGVAVEVRGLADNNARPADIHTIAAVPGRRAALDVCICSLNASTAGGDAATSAFREKLRKYAAIIPQLHRDGIAFRPLIWTADGRPHPAVRRTLKFAGERLAMQGGGHRSAAEAVRRWEHEIAIAIARRRAAMTRAVLPKLRGAARWIASGVTEGKPTSANRQVSLEDDSDTETSESGDREVIMQEGGVSGVPAGDGGDPLPS